LDIVPLIIKIKLIQYINEIRVVNILRGGADKAHRISWRL